jgi:hypothetical protein
MAVLGPGQIFGFMSLLDGGAHGSAASARQRAGRECFSAEADQDCYFS